MASRSSYSGHPSMQHSSPMNPLLCPLMMAMGAMHKEDKYGFQTVCICVTLMVHKGSCKEKKT